MSTKTVISTFGTFTDDELKVLKGSLREMSDVFTMQEAQKEVLKNIVDAVHDELKIPKNLIKKLGKVYHKRNYTEVATENSEFELLYEGLIDNTDN